jgi:hypothetical protein
LMPFLFSQERPKDAPAPSSGLECQLRLDEWIMDHGRCPLPLRRSVIRPGRARLTYGLGNVERRGVS